MDFFDEVTEDCFIFPVDDVEDCVVFPVVVVMPVVVHSGL